MIGNLNSDRKIALVWNVIRPHVARMSGAILLAGLIFVLDIGTALNGSASILYFLVIMIMSEVRSRLIVRITSLICALLTIGSYLIIYQSAHSTATIIQLSLFLFTNLMTTAILIRQLRDRELSEAQAKLLHMTNEAIVLMDADGLIIYWNRGAEQLFGFSAEHVLGRKPDDITIIEFPISRTHTEATLDSVGSWQGELRIRTGYGRWVHVFSRWKLERRESGDRATVTTASFDITSQKLGEAAVRESNARYRTIFETLAVGVWEHDLRPLRRFIDDLQRQGIGDLRGYFDQNPSQIREMMKVVPITDVNQTVLRLLGIPSKDEFPTCLNDVLPGDDCSFVEFVHAFAAGEKVFQFDAQVLHRDGSRIPVTTAMNIPDDGLTGDRLHVSVIDIRERVAFQEAIEESRRELDYATKAAVVGEVSASIAHEVNQPLTAINAYLYAALRFLEKPHPSIGDAVDAIKQSLYAADNATTVVNRVRLLLGKAKPEDAEVFVVAVLNQALRLKSSELNSSKIRTSLIFDKSNTRIQGDRVLLQQAFVNIIGNAIEAMTAVPDYARSLIVRLVSRGDNIVVSFQDTGPGIDEDRSDALFKPFATTKSSGMGLGLAMCRSIALAHRGDVQIRNSSYGTGAIVEMTLRPLIGHEPSNEGGIEVMAETISSS